MHNASVRGGDTLRLAEINGKARGGPFARFENASVAFRQEMNEERR
jgi:hypothetical protein